VTPSPPEERTVEQSDQPIDLRVLDCFRSVFPDRSDDELRALDQSAVDYWDSLAALSLLTVVEEEFDLTIDDESIDAMTTFQKVCDAIRERVG
jgi:acyl carrier protein